MQKIKTVNNILLKVFDWLEMILSHVRGRGYYSITNKREVFLIGNILYDTPMLAIDVGGNIGEYTANLRELYPDLEVHIFEPSSTNYDKLNKRFAADKLIKLLPYAISNSTGEATLYSDKPGSVLSSLYKRKLDHMNINFDIKEKVKTMRFEEYWVNVLKKRNIDIVKLDVEGNELDTLNGFGDAIMSTNVIQFEFGGADIDTRIFFRDFWFFFNDKKFQLFRMTPLGLEKIDRYREKEESFLYANYVAVNNNIN